MSDDPEYGTPEAVVGPPEGLRKLFNLFQKERGKPEATKEQWQEMFSDLEGEEDNET